MVDRDRDTCPACGGNPFHRFGCPHVILPMTFITVSVGVVIAAIVIAGNPKGFDLRFMGAAWLICVATLAIWALLGRQRNR